MATIIEMPKLSDTMTVGVLVNWLKKVGDQVESGDILAEVETDKATMELENFDEGILLTQYVKEGDKVPIGGAICAIGEEGEEIPDPNPKSKATKNNQKKTKNSDNISKENKSAIKDTATLDSVKENDSKIKASPLARKIAIEHNIPLNAINGSGPGGRILKEDILHAVEESLSAAAEKPDAVPLSDTSVFFAREGKNIPVSNMREVIARRLLESKNTIPHIYLEIEIDAEPILEVRATLNKNLADLAPEKGGAKLTINDLIMKGCAESLRRVPAVNRSWQGDTITQHHNVHLAFAVAVEDGLLTPVIRNIDNKSLRQVSADAKELAVKAKNKKLTPDEMQGSTFTVSNLGMYGITSFYGIINPPNAALLSIGAVIVRPVVDKHNNIVPGKRMTLGLSGDHRVIDGAAGAHFLENLKEILEAPALMMV